MLAAQQAKHTLMPQAAQTLAPARQCAWFAFAVPAAGTERMGIADRPHYIRFMTTTVDALIETYARLYSAQDAERVAALCEAPFLAIRSGGAIHLADADAVREHFGTMMRAYRDQHGAASWTPVEVEPHPLGEFSSFVTVRWNARNDDGDVVRDTKTTYHLLAAGDGWRFLSYTNHF